MLGPVHLQVVKAVLQDSIHPIPEHQARVNVSSAELGPGRAQVHRSVHYAAQATGPQPLPRPRCYSATLATLGYILQSWVPVTFLNAVPVVQVLSPPSAGPPILVSVLHVLQVSTRAPDFPPVLVAS